MAKLKIIISIVMLVLLGGVLTFGIFSLSSGKYGVVNQTTFVSGNENVFVKIIAEYDGPQLQNAYKPNKTYTYTLDRSVRESFNEEPVEITPWDLGPTYFFNRDYEITLTFTLQNLNTDNGLAINFKNLAFDQYGKFHTSYAIASTRTELAEMSFIKITEGNGNNTANIPEIVIEKSAQKIVQIKFTQKVFNEEFEFDNNIQVVMDTVVQA